MLQEKVQPARRKYIWAIAATILVACLLLFSLDSDPGQFSDLFHLDNLIGLVIYFVPTFFLCRLLYRLFQRKQNTTESLILSLIIGIPLSFALIIALLVSLKHWIG